MTVLERPLAPRVSAGLSRRLVRHVRDDRNEQAHDWIAVEEPLEIRIDGETFATTMRTPGADRELALGLLLAEGLVRSRRDIGGVAHCGRPGEEGYGNVIDVQAAPGTVLDDEQAARGRRRLVTSSSCGVCGRASIDDLKRRAPSVETDATWRSRALERLAATLSHHQGNFERSGGVHAAGIVLSEAGLAHVYEDVGRHNAVDKVFGRLLLDDALPAAGAVLVVSGRASFEIVQKACVGGAAFVVSVSAPTSLAVDTAHDLGVTLVGFAREGRLNVYTHAHRVVDER